MLHDACNTDDACDSGLLVTLTSSFLDLVLDHEVGSRASMSEMVGTLSGILPASTPAAATAVERRPMVLRGFSTVDVSM